MGVAPPWSDSQHDGETFWHGLFDTEKWCDAKVVRGSNIVKTMLPAPEVALLPGDKVKLGCEVFKVMSNKGSTLYLNEAVEQNDGVYELTGQVVPYERNADSRMAKHFREQVLVGDRDVWDTSLLCFALLKSSHGLMEGVDDAVAYVEGLRELRNKSLAHVRSCRMAPSKLAAAVESMDLFVKTCLPQEWEEWFIVSRGVLQQYDPMQQQAHQHVPLQQPPAMQQHRVPAEQQHLFAQHQRYNVWNRYSPQKGSISSPQQQQQQQLTDLAQEFGSSQLSQAPQSFAQQQYLSQATITSQHDQQQLQRAPPCSAQNQPQPQSRQYQPAAGTFRQPTGAHARAMQSAEQSAEAAHIGASSFSTIRQQETICQRFWAKELQHQD